MMIPNGRSHLPAAVDPPIECSQDEAIARFYGEWVLYQILEEDEHHDPIRGLVLAHSPSRREISKVLATYPVRTADQPYQPFYTFYAMPRTHAGESIEAARARFERQRADALNRFGSQRA